MTRRADSLDFSLMGARLSARPSGVLWWAEERLAAVGDLHLGKAERMARRGGGLLPPYETAETLARLGAEIRALDPATVICLGDSFDDMAAARDLGATIGAEVAAMAAGRRWVWIAGNHDPHAPGLPGETAGAVSLGPLDFRHVAARSLDPGRAEVSAHFHPKARVIRKGAAISRRCFLAGEGRLILPAFGTYTGGLDVRHPTLMRLVGPSGCAMLTGRRVHAVRLDRLEVA